MEEHFPLGKTSENLKYVTMNRPGSGPSVCGVTALYLDVAPRDFGLKVAFFLRVARLLI